MIFKSDQCNSLEKNHSSIASIFQYKKKLITLFYRVEYYYSPYLRIN